MDELVAHRTSHRTPTLPGDICAPVLRAHGSFLSAALHMSCGLCRDERRKLFICASCFTQYVRSRRVELEQFREEHESQALRLRQRLETQVGHGSDLSQVVLAREAVSRGEWFERADEVGGKELRERGAGGRHGGAICHGHQTWGT